MCQPSVVVLAALTPRDRGSASLVQHIRGNKNLGFPQNFPCLFLPPCVLPPSVAPRSQRAPDISSNFCSRAFLSGVTRCGAAAVAGRPQLFSTRIAAASTALDVRGLVVAVVVVDAVFTLCDIVRYRAISFVRTETSMAYTWYGPASHNLHVSLLGGIQEACRSIRLVMGYNYLGRTGFAFCAKMRCASSPLGSVSAMELIFFSFSQ